MNNINYNSVTLKDLGYQQTKICLFSAGNLLRYLVADIRDLGLEATYLCDHDVSKHGEYFSGLLCQDISVMNEDKENVLIITSIDENLVEEIEDTIKQLHEMGFDHVVTRFDFLKKCDEICIRACSLYILDKCNLNCRYCSVVGNLNDDSLIPVEKVKQDLDHFSKVAKDCLLEFRILGGEPLLHDDLLEIMAYARFRFPTTRILLITNGLTLLSQTDDFWACCKENSIIVTPSRYPIPLDFDAMEQKAKEKDVLFKYIHDIMLVGEKKMHKFAFDLEGTQNVEDSFTRCKRDCAIIREGKFFPCLPPMNAKKINNNFGTSLNQSKEDYLGLDEITSTKELLHLNASSIPFCAYCDMKNLQYGLKWEQKVCTIEDLVASKE